MIATVNHLWGDWIDALASRPDRVSAVRHFNRFYTRQIGVLREGLLHSPYSITEARIIYDLGHREGLTAAKIGPPETTEQLRQGLPAHIFVDGVG